MRCGCLPRMFRRPTRTGSLLNTVDTLLQKSKEQAPTELPPQKSIARTENSGTEAERSVRDEEDFMEVDVSPTSEKLAETESPKDVDEKQERMEKVEKKTSNSERMRRNGSQFFRGFFKSVSSVEETPIPWIRCECSVDETTETVCLLLHYDDELNGKAIKASSNPSSTIQSLFRIRGRRQRDETEMQDLIRARHPSSSSAKTENSEEDNATETVRPKERSVFCFGWGQTGVLNDDDDEAITVADGVIMTDTPPGLVGLLNLGNTCFLNAALQCLRCTPGFASLIVPQLSNGFEGAIRKEAFAKDSEKENWVPVRLSSYKLRTLGSRSHSASCLLRPRSLNSEWNCAIVVRSSSLLMPLPDEIGGRLVGETGLAGGAVSRLPSAPNLELTYEPTTTLSEAPSSSHRVDPSVVTTTNGGDSVHVHNKTSFDPFVVRDGDVEEIKEQMQTAEVQSDGNGETRDPVAAPLPDCSVSSTGDRDPPDTQQCAENHASPIESETNNEQHVDPTTTHSNKLLEDKTTEIIEDKENEQSESTKAEGDGAKKETTPEEEEPEVELSADFISAFHRLVLEVCLGEADKHRSPHDLYLQLKKLPQGEWFCDGGQHDCQEILKVLLDAIHASYEKEVSERVHSFGRCISDVSTEGRDEMEEIELENTKANSMWKSYLSRDASPVTDVFAGQLQIVRTCQKCHCRSSTYEPFWDLSLSLSREKSSWFNPGRMPSSLDDLLRAFTAAEVLQGDEAPYCECCEQKSPATRRILIHRFPKVLVINIKRFKYTKDGREKLTSNIAFPVHSLRLQSFASKEHQHEELDELYDLYAVSNHFGTLAGGHYTAFCKVRDESGKDGWYSFNDKSVTKMHPDAVITPNAYILFYAKRPTLTVSDP